MARRQALRLLPQVEWLAARLGAARYGAGQPASLLSSLMRLLLSSAQSVPQLLRIRLPARLHRILVGQRRHLAQPHALAARLHRILLSQRKRLGCFVAPPHANRAAQLGRRQRSPPRLDLMLL